MSMTVQQATAAATREPMRPRGPRRFRDRTEPRKHERRATIASYRMIPEQHEALRQALLQHMEAGRPDLALLMWESHDLPGDFLGADYPYDVSLDEVVAEMHVRA